MHGFTRRLIFRSGSARSGWGRLWLVALCVCGAALSTAALADDGKHRGDHQKFRGQHSTRHSTWSHSRHFDGRHDGRRSSWQNDRHDRGRYNADGRDWNRRNWRGWDRRDHVWRYDGRRDLHRSWHGSDWRYYRGRYWAPAYYRGRRCNDLRHYHGIHYHVAVRDYYGYYYPRYRYYGPRPLGANASVIISIPLF